MPYFSYFFWFSIGVLGLWLGFPNVLYHIPLLVLLYPLSLYIVGSYADNKLDALRKGWIIGLFGSWAALYWLSIPIHNVGKLPWPLAIPCALAIGAYVGLYAGIFSLVSYITKIHIPKDILARCLALACVWYFLELLRGIVLTGFPWLQISSAFVPWSFMIQAVSLIGSHALSALYVLAALCIIEAILNKNLRFSIFASVCIIIPICYGLYTLQQNPIQVKSSDDFSFIMAEANIDQNIKWEISSQQLSLDTYKNLTTNALELWRKQNPEQSKAMVIWPETAMPFYLEQHRLFTPELKQFVKDMQLPLLVGAPGAIVYSKQKREIFNRAYLLDQQGQINRFYDKIHLVPFGEYVPSWLLINFLEPLLQGIGNFTPGKQSKPLVYDQLALGMLICYESVFSHIARQRVSDGANILVNISNDGWFGDSSAPEQHLQLGILRAVEQGRWLVRSTNTGISAIVDEFGRFVLKGGQFKAQSYVGYAKTKLKTTIFYHLSPWLHYIMMGIFLCALYLGKKRSSNEK